MHKDLKRLSSGCLWGVGHSLKIQEELCREKRAQHKAGNSFQKFYFLFQWAKTWTVRLCAGCQLFYFIIRPENYLSTKTLHCVSNKGHLLLMPCKTPHWNFLLHQPQYVSMRTQLLCVCEPAVLPAADGCSPALSPRAARGLYPSSLHLQFIALIFLLLLPGRSSSPYPLGKRGAALSSATRSLCKREGRNNLSGTDALSGARFGPPTEVKPARLPPRGWESHE